MERLTKRELNKVGNVHYCKCFFRDCDGNCSTYIALASHCIGLDHSKPYKRRGRYFYKPYRNYYDASIKDCEIWDMIVAAGYAEAGKKDRYGGRMYWLNRNGLDWLGEKLGIHIWDEEE